MVFGAMDAAFWQAQAMARAIGVNLTDALAEGLIDRNRYSDLVARCTLCPHMGECGKWMGSVCATAAPSFCRIKTDLDRMQTGARA